MHISLAGQTGKKLYMLRHDGLSSVGLMTETGKTDEIADGVIFNLLSGSAPSAMACSNLDRMAYILNEKQNAVSADAGLQPYAIQIFPKPGRFVSEISDALVVNAHQHERFIYEFERISADNIKTVYTSNGIPTCPLNDVIDTAVKTYVYKTERQVNPYIPGNVGSSTSNSTRNERFDIYYSIDETPVGFTQANNMAYMLTKPSLIDAYYLKTELRDNLDADICRQEFGYSLSANKFETVLYRTNPSGASSIGSNLSGRLITDEQVRDIFRPARVLTGIEYNHFLKMKQQDDVTLQTQTDYDDGNIFGMPFTMKNMYNACYTMDMSSDSNINNCREYYGVGTIGGQPYFKYYDNVSYDMTGDTASKSYGKYSYQKIELVYEVAGSTQTKHKSTLFSIKLGETGLAAGVSDNEKTAKLKENIRNDITNSIRGFVDEICPANTQLFNVYFNS